MALLGYFKKFFPQPEDNEVAKDILAMCLTLSSKEKWCQGTLRYYDEAGNVERVCLYGAWETLNKRSPRTLNVLNQYIRERTPKREWSNLEPDRAVMRWNDDPKRTFEDVQNLLFDVAKFLGVLTQLTK